MRTTYGYARVSTIGQTLEAQLDELKAVGCARIFRETVSGARADRRELNKLLAALQAGDVVVVTRIDRLACSIFDLFAIVKSIVDRKAQFRSLAEPWSDTSTATGRLMIALLAGLADVERDLIRTRTAEGHHRAKARGVKLGRRPKLTPQQRQEALARWTAGESLVEIARSYNVSFTTIWRHCHQGQNAPAPDRPHSQHGPLPRDERAAQPLQQVGAAHGMGSNGSVRWSARLRPFRHRAESRFRDSAASHSEAQERLRGRLSPRVSALSELARFGAQNLPPVSKRLINDWQIDLMSTHAKHRPSLDTAASTPLDETGAKTRMASAVERWHPAYDLAIDRVLRESFQHVLDEPVPERFVVLLDRLAEGAR